MALIKPVPSDQTKRALLTGVADFIAKTDPLGNVLKQTPLGLHVFTLRLQDIVNGVGIAGAKSAGWRFLAGSPFGPAVAGDVIERPGAAPKMTSVSRDPLIAAAIRATHEVETLPEVQRNDYELRVVRIPGLLIEAFWLKSTAGGPDLAIPVLTRTKQLQPMKVYPLDEFLNIVGPLTRSFLAFDY